jgi:hypothetical protein
MSLMVYKNRTVEVIETSGSLSKINDDGNEYSVKTASLKAPKTPRRPKSLNIVTITESMKPFVTYLLTAQAKTLLTLEAQCEEMDFAVRKQYTALTGGDELVEGAGYHVAPESAKKEGCEGSVTFVMPTDESIITPEITAMMTQRPGLINRIGFVWALVEAGFKVARVLG